MLKRFPLAPFLLGIFPVLSLLATNTAEVSLSVALRPIAFVLLLSLFLLLFFRVVLRRWDRAGVVTSFLLVLFFSYGHIYSLLEGHPIGGINFGRHRYLVVVYAFILFIGLWVLIARLKKADNVLSALNVISLLLLVTPVWQISSFVVQTSTQQKQAAQTSTQLDAPLQPRLQPLPDIYYIVLDSHTRSDALLADFNLDNSAYLSDLRQLGFYIADCARTNYTYTQGAIVAALNMDYLNNLESYRQASDSKDAWILLKQSRVRSLLEGAGYKTVAFNTGYEWSTLTDADIYLSLGSNSYSIQKVNPFEGMLIKSTAMLILTDSQVRYLQSRFKEIIFPYGPHVVRENFILDQLPLIADDPDPTFTFAHILVPHVPFVFEPDGSVVTDPLFYNGEKAWPGDDIHRTVGYANQVEFIDRRIDEVVRAILANSDTPPIIVIHGDHGLLEENRFEILNAYYLPGGNTQKLYPSITPVNSFRLIFDQYFGTHYGLLPDVSYNQAGQTVEEISPACVGQ